MPLLGATEPQVRYFSPMPRDYQFVPKGDVYITSNVRRRTHAAGAILYVVVDKHRKPIGLRCPTSIYQEVTAAAQASAESRAAVVRSRDAAVEREFKAEVVRLYPEVPLQDVPKILRRTLEKRSRRVGRTGTLNLEFRVHLAVKAYIRHCCTPYEELLKDGMGREEARKRVVDRLEEVARSWSGTKYRMETLGATASRKRKKPNDRSEVRDRTRKAKGTYHVPRRPAQPGAETSQSKGDVEDASADEASEGDDFSDFDDDSEDSDWAP
ncbi:hypothetical protein NKR19_g1848 [Coniochaeta hoffmannii]|uniref:DUF2293 domain-containing protein n=1 Tax=Coniochaeta hoffmannii TaxID=91930 RepID=A0AA38VNM1_9PEZI|nr:hypothetical protein NKR19_g1848 [Coniochaeta hoffmannii]